MYEATRATDSSDALDKNTFRNHDLEAAQLHLMTGAFVVVAALHRVVPDAGCALRNSEALHAISHSREATACIM